MDINYKVMVIHWSIFTLWMRLMCCASVHASQINGIHTESLCQVSKERRVESSLALELKPNSNSGPCKQILEAPESHGLYIRLDPTNPSGEKKSTSGGTNKNMNTGQRIRNTTSPISCPINIYQTSNKSSLPWRIDPCQLELRGEEEARLLAAPLRIVWHHSRNYPNYRLTITAYGNGEVCEEEGRHPCLKLGSNKLVCISEALLCDGIRHCPTGKEFESDESEAVCELVEKKKNQWYIKMFRDLIRKGVQSSFPSLAAQETNSNGTESLSSDQQETIIATTTLGSQYNKTIFVTTVIDPTSSNIRKNFPRGLSKYGPWGYLMLGMLLCGGSLLVCGLWECCCRKQKPVVPLTAGSLDQQPVDVNIVSDAYAQQNRSDSLQAVINYDETEPPPSYAVLFPHQKSTEDLTQVATGSYNTAFSN